MLHQMFSVHDAKAEAYLPPFFARARGEALRMFESAVSDREHQFAKHPEDYTLFFLGTFDDSTGQIASESTPHPLGKAIEFVRQMELPTEETLPFPLPYRLREEQS